MTFETPTTNPVKTNKARRWLRFRLRTLLIMVTLLSVSLGWVGWELDQRRREKEVVAWVEEMGGRVRNVSLNSEGERNWWEKTKDKWFGGRVRSVRLVGTKVSDLSPLEELKNLETLGLVYTQVCDLSPLAELKNLKSLTLFATPVNDLSPLSELKNLQMLLLSGTQVSEKQVEELRLALPNCEIGY